MYRIKFTYIWTLQGSLIQSNYGILVWLSPVLMQENSRTVRYGFRVLGRYSLDPRSRNFRLPVIPGGGGGGGGKTGILFMVRITRERTFFLSCF